MLLLSVGIYIGIVHQTLSFKPSKVWADHWRYAQTQLNASLHSPSSNHVRNNRCCLYRKKKNVLDFSPCQRLQMIPFLFVKCDTANRIPNVILRYEFIFYLRITTLNHMLTLSSCDSEINTDYFPKQR